MDLRAGKVPHGPQSPAKSHCPLCVAGMLRPSKQVPEAVAEMGKDPGFLSAGLGWGRAQNKGHLPR